MLNNILTNQKLSYAILTLFGLLFFIYPIPHTIAIRYIVIILMFILTIFYAKNINLKYQTFKESPIYIPTLLYTALILWSIFVAIFSKYTLEAMGQIKSQLIMPMLVGFVAFVIANDTTNKYFSKQRILMLIFFSIFIHVAYSGLESIKYFLHHGKLLTRSPAMIGLDNLNFVTAFLLAILTVEVYFRIIDKKYYLPFDNFYFSLITIFIFFDFIVIQAKRLGVTSVAFLIGSLIILLIIRNRKRLNKKIVLIIITFTLITGGFIYKSFKNDPRWQTLIKTIPIAMNTEKYSAWRGKEIPELLPNLPNGKKVSGSNYMRIAWITKSIKLIIENPFGYGFSKLAFKNIIKAKYPNEKIRVTQAHSGFADLGLGSGIIGLMLWYGLIGYVIYISLKNYIEYENYFSLLSLFISTGFSFRMFIDSIFRDQELQQFLAMLILFLIFSQEEIKKNVKKFNKTYRHNNV